MYSSRDIFNIDCCIHVNIDLKTTWEEKICSDQLQQIQRSIWKSKVTHGPTSCVEVSWIVSWHMERNELMRYVAGLEDNTWHKLEKVHNNGWKHELKRNCRKEDGLIVKHVTHN